MFVPLAIARTVSQDAIPVREVQVRTVRTARASGSPRGAGDRPRSPHGDSRAVSPSPRSNVAKAIDSGTPNRLALLEKRRSARMSPSRHSHSYRLKS